MFQNYCFEWPWPFYYESWYCSRYTQDDSYNFQMKLYDSKTAISVSTYAKSFMYYAMLLYVLVGRYRNWKCWNQTLEYRHFMKSFRNKCLYRNFLTNFFGYFLPLIRCPKSGRYSLPTKHPLVPSSYIG